MENPKINVLAEYLNIGKQDIVQGYDENTFEVDREEYLVLTDAEANEETKSYIKDSVWTFTPSFLERMTNIDKAVFEALQPQCESANDAILKLVETFCGLDKFVEEAVASDGRGHFLSSYDWVENQVGEFYIYRTN